MRLGLILGTLCLCLGLAACGRGQDSDKVSIGTGQSTDSADSSGADYPIFYVKRTTPDMTMTDDDVRRQRVFFTNADLYKRDRASPSAAETNITARVRSSSTELWDVKDVDTAYDGSKVIFAMRGPLDPDQEDNDPPSWNIWEYVIATDDLHRVISDDVTAEAGQDISPHYTADGHILFSSTRQRESKAVLLDESKTQFEAQDENRDESAFDLHVMDANSDIHQITFNQSHDLDPTVLSDGRVMWSRWDHANGKNGIHLYTANPDGTNVQLLYGAASHNTVQDTDAAGQTSFPAVQFVKAREMRNGRILALVRPFSGTEFGGDLYIIDTATYVENNQATAANGGMPGPAQTKAVANNIRLVPAPSPGGRFNSAAPLWDGSDRILTTWTQCRILDASRNNMIVPCTSDLLSDPAVQAAPPLYSVWMYDPSNGTLQPVVAPVEGVMISDVATAQPRTTPIYKTTNYSNNIDVNQTLAGEGVGILDIRSVYDFDGAVGGLGTLISCGITGVANPINSTCYTNRPARFLRIEKAVSLPDRDTHDFDASAFGPTGQFMREILGYLPIEPDGSVRVKVPANVAFQISVLDENGRRLTGTFSRHNAWLSLRPGETVSCNGCHTPQAGQNGVSGVSHGRIGLFAQAYTGTSSARQTFAGANTNFISTNPGDTMARTRAFWSCANEQCRSITPSVDMIYSDVWPTQPGSWNTATAGCAAFSESAYSGTTPNICRTGDFAYKYTGSAGIRTAPPTSSLCTTTWSNVCRITINYLEYIQPIWELSRTVDVNNDNLPDVDANGVVIDHKCVSCHVEQATVPPAGQLDLTSNDSEDEPDQKVSYRELLFQDNVRVINAAGTALEDQCVVQNIDPVTGLPSGCAQFATVSPPLLALNARGSRFFQVFSQAGATVDHRGFLTSGELRLISEWVDIGAQYYNDPFKAPEN